MATSLANLLSIVGLTSPAIIFWAMDRYFRKDLKNKLADAVYGSTNSTLAERISLLHNLIQRSLGNSASTKLLRLIILSIISIAFIYSAQYHINRDAFNNIAKTAINSAHENPTFLALTAISFIVVDLISFLQTLTFLRLTGNCKNIFEIAFLAIADVTLSLFIVIAVLPVLIFVIHKTTTFPQQRTIYLALSGGVQRQDLSIYQVLRMAVPTIRQSTPKEEWELKEDLAQFNASGWYYNMPDVYATDRKQPDVDEAADGLEFSAGQSLYLTKGDMSIEQEGSMLAEIISTHPNITSARYKDGLSDTFGNYIMIFEVVGTGDYSRLNLFSNYSSLMSDVNFFGQDFGKVFSLSEKGYSENELAWKSIFNNFVSGMDDTLVLKCANEKPIELSKSDFSKRSDKCPNAVGATKLNIEGIGALSSYKFSNVGVIPILPTSLSSIFLTFTIYVMTLAWIILPYARRFVAQFSEDGDKLFTQNVFFITFSVFVAALLPIWLIL